MVKRILVPLDASPYTDAALEYACFIAKHKKAELTGMVVLDIKGIEKSVGPVPMGGSYYAQKLREKNKVEALEQIERLLEKFRETCRREGVAGNTNEDQGSPGERIIEISKFYDLVILGMRTHFKFGETDTNGETVHKILDHSITPILAVPDYFHKPDPTNRVVVAFNGSLPAARSLQRFAHLLNPDYYDVTILVSGGDMEMAHYNLDQAESYLNVYGFKNITKEWTPKNIIDALEEDFYHKADLIVAGMHSKKGLFDFFLGSLSKYVLEKAEKAVLLGQ